MVRLIGIVFFMKKLLSLIFLFSLTSFQLKSEQVQNGITKNKFDDIKIAFWDFNNDDLNWIPPEEPRDLKEIRYNLTSLKCKLNSFGISSDCYDNENQLIKIPNKKWIYTYKYEDSPDEPYFLYVSDVKKIKGNEDLVIFSTLYIAFNTQYEELNYEISLSKAGDYDRIDCSTTIPIWFANVGKEENGIDAWEQATPEIKDVSFESFKRSDWYYEGMDSEEEREAFKSFKDTLGWLQYMCKIAD